MASLLALAMFLRGPMRASALVRAAITLLLGMAWPVLSAQAQTVDATQWEAGTVNLSKSLWRVHEGDNPAWAQTKFDDSGWKTVALKDLGAAQTGWRWFRLHVELAHGHPHLHLLIVGGEGVYAAYVNGEAVEDAQLEPWYALKRPVEEIIPLPDDADEVTLALRTDAIPTYTLWHLPLFLYIEAGTPDLIDSERWGFESQRLYPAVASIAINLVLLLAGLGAFALYASQKDHAEYLWLGLYLCLSGVSNACLNSSSAGILSLAWNNLLADPLVYIDTILQIQFTFRFAGQRVGKAWRAYQALLVLLPLLAVTVTLGWLSITPYILMEGMAILPAALLLPVLLFLWYRRGNREAGWLILPSLLPAATSALYDLGSASIFMGWGRADFLAYPIPLGPVQLQIADLSNFLFVLAIAVVMFHRFTRVSREQTRVAAELEAAREMQQRLVPALLPEVAGYAIEAAYLPAQEVGGDFYQIIAQQDGAWLVVVGDVSGKGLRAAMTGTLTMGALRTLSTEGLRPGALLRRLNRQLTEAGDAGFVTCVCVWLGNGGEMVVANAGHLPPYRNGEELALDADLPLGIAANETYCERSFRLADGDRLTLLSDGVVEARNAHGTLFGFERTRAISTQAAEAIARAAQEYGQEDDITVLTLTRKRRDQAPGVRDQDERVAVG